MAKPILTQDYLKECLHYDPETGVFTWKARPREHFKTSNAFSRWAYRIGCRCGHIDSPGGYLVISINDVSYSAHRLAFLYMEGAEPSFVDHINHIRSDIRWVNLRAATLKDNQQNQSLSKRNTSGYSGIVFEKSRGKWKVHMRGDGKHQNIGRYKNLSDAIEARDKAREKFGYHENHGKNL
jgi:hypothetical protein